MGLPPLRVTPAIALNETATGRLDGLPIKKRCVHEASSEDGFEYEKGSAGAELVVLKRASKNFFLTHFNDIFSARMEYVTAAQPSRSL
jgi:hypothetical protein